eukprot:g29163.t1
MCSSHPKCKALGLTHACCPASDGAWLECCDPPEDKHTEEHGFSTISLQSWHGGYISAFRWGSVGHSPDLWRGETRFYVDGSVSLRSKSSDKYVAAEMPDWGVLSADRDEIDDWEKFNVTVNHGWDTVIPNDEKFEKLWGLNHYGGRDIDAPEAWRFFPAPPSNSIVDVYGADFANGDGDPFDDQMHGTHCAGTIAGHGNNGEGVAGVAWSGVKLMALKFLSATGGGRTSDAIKCLNYAVAMGAKITSNSWGGGGSSSAMRVAIERAERAGVLFIAAAGNEGSDNDAMPHYPSNYAASNVVSIASTTKTGSLSSFSCYGQERAGMNRRGDETVDVAAPGSAIYSTIPNQKYASLSGTSMATPHVSGLAALIWLYRPNLAMSQVIDIILDSATREDALLNSSVTSARINARRALLLASRYRGLQPPVHKPLGLSFEDTDPEVGLLAGDAKITRAWDESDIDYYSLHFISSAGFLLDTLATVEKTAELGPVLTIPLVNLTIPKYAAKLAVVAGNATGRAEPFMAVTTEIKDYCVPQYGPSRAQWLGDADGRPGFVAGALQFRRASSEKSLTHYNVYWHRAAALAAPQGTDAAEETTGFLGKVPASGFERPSCEGDCEISFSGPATVVVTRFRTEKYYDFLEVDDMQLTGTKLALPMKIKLETRRHREASREGWSLELHQKGTTAEYQLASIEPPVMELSVVAAFDDTEGAAPALGRLEDFDASTMPPSAALTARDLRFVDGNVQQDLMTGKIEFWPPQHGSSSVTFYRVYFADAQGAALPDFTWKLDAPDSSDQMLHIDIDTQKPAAATTIVVVSGNDHGEGEEHAQWCTYDDVEMEEGVHLDFEDFVDTSDLGFSWRTGANGRSLSPSEQKETEPSSGSGKRSATSKMALKVKGSLTIPGLPVSSDASEMSGTTIPPSLELRQALLSSLAEVLSLDTAQLRLTQASVWPGDVFVARRQGERAACETLKRGATEPGTRRLGNLLDSHPVCLLVHFEVLPDGEVALHPKLTQDFLDRVEAKMIRLNQGHHQAKLDAALAHRLHGLTTLTDLHALIGEPQQVAPKARSRGGSGRVLSTFEESGTVVTIKESEPGSSRGRQGEAIAKSFFSRNCDFQNTGRTSFSKETETPQVEDKDAGTNEAPLQRSPDLVEDDDAENAAKDGIEGDRKNLQLVKTDFCIFAFQKVKSAPVTAPTAGAAKAATKVEEEVTSPSATAEKDGTGQRAAPVKPKTSPSKKATEPQVVAKEAAKDAFFGERHAWKQPVSSIVLYCEERNPRAGRREPDAAEQDAAAGLIAEPTLGTDAEQDEEVAEAQAAAFHKADHAEILKTVQVEPWRSSAVDGALPAAALARRSCGSG